MPAAQEFAKLFREHLLSHGYGPRPGATDDEIAAFESRHGLRLPDDLREYFRQVNGTAEYPDDLLTNFLSLVDVKPITDRLSENDVARYFVFADQMISAPDFAIGLGGSTPSVVRCWGNELQPVSDSFLTFIRLFMEDPWTIHLHDHAAPV